MSYRRVDPSEDPTRFDLTALLDVLSSVVFFLLASLSAVVVAGVPVLTPAAKTPLSEPAGDKSKVEVTVRLKASGETEVRVASSTVRPEELAPFLRTIAPVPRKGGEVDAHQLGEHLASIRSKFPGSKAATIVPDDDAAYETLIAAMDACRERKRTIGGRTVFEPLFPHLVVSALSK